MFGVTEETLDALRRQVLQDRSREAAAVYADALEESGEVRHAAFWRLNLAGQLWPRVWQDRSRCLWFGWVFFGYCCGHGTGSVFWRMARRWPLTDPLEDW